MENFILCAVIVSSYYHFGKAKSQKISLKFVEKKMQITSKGFHFKGITNMHF